MGQLINGWVLYHIQTFIIQCIPQSQRSVNIYDNIFTNYSNVEIQEFYNFSTLNLFGCLGSNVPVLFIIIIVILELKKLVMQVIENERMSTFGSNESQQGLQSSPTRPQNNSVIKDQWLLCLSQKFSQHIANLIRMFFCITIGMVLASRIAEDNIKQISNGIIASSDILLDKSLRGVFPPLDGTRPELYGKWDLYIITSAERTSNRFNKYSLNFKSNGDVQITHKNCNGDIKSNWHIFYYNIGLKQKQIPQSNITQQMQIPNEKQDIQCIVKDGQFMSILYNASIWTIHLDNLYMISQVKKSYDINLYMLIFKKA